MNKTKIKNFILGTTLIGGMVNFGAGVIRGTRDKDKDKDDNNTEIPPIQSTDTASNNMNYNVNDPYGNVALFESARSKIKFALAFVEGFSSTAYTDKKEGGTWTVGHGLTILYNDDGTHTRVTKTSKCTLDESDVFKNRYLTNEILPDIQKCITVPIDENTLVATCVFRYCVGHSNFKKSTYLKNLNAGKSGADLARYLTGFRRQKGVLKRLYFFAAIMSDKLEFRDLLDLHAEGCYDLLLPDVVMCNSKDNILTDDEGMATWNFAALDNNLLRAQQFGDRKFTKEIVPDYIWADVLRNGAQLAKTSKPTPNIIDLLHSQKKMHDIAIKKIRSGNYNDALKMLDALAKTNYNSARLQNDIAYTQYLAGNHKTAISVAKSALKMSSSDQDKSVAFYNMGMAYAARGEYDKAIKCFDNAIALNNSKTIQKARDATEKLRQESKQSSSKRRGSRAVLFIAGGAAAAYGGRKKYNATKSRAR